MLRLNSIFLIITFLLLSLNIFSQDDVEGSKDHPLISRYEGSYIIGYDQSEYDQLILPAGPYEGDETKTVSPEGIVTRILYAAPRGRSSLEVHRNYQLALRDAGFEFIYECSKNCQRLPRIFYEYDQQLKNRGDLSRFAISYDRSTDQRYLLARYRGPKGSTYASIYTVLSTGNYYGEEEKKEIENRPVTLLQIVEEKQMETGKVRVNADEIANSIRNTGRVKLYGIHFETDKSQIDPSSYSSLNEIAEFLKNNSDIKIAVVGHTDAAGSLDYNMQLSKERADAVVDYLVSEKGISSRRLESYGVGPLSPVASNQSETGRAKNRRVELVKLN